jgi:apolipoprotein N-acyltransferase
MDIRFEHWRHLVQGKLRRQVTLPAVLGLVQLLLAAASIARGDAPATVLFWLVPALLVGLAFGRATRVVWDSDAYQAVLVGGQMVLTLAWLAIQLGSRPALTRALGDLSYAGAITLVMAGGLVIGHSLALLGRIGRALPERR